MTPEIRFNKISSDDEMFKLAVEVCDGESSFRNEIYVGHQQLREMVSGLHNFKRQVHHGLFNLRLGEFGCEYASGALDARFQFRARGKILVSVSAQSEFREFEDRFLASEAKLYLVSETALLDEFVRALGLLSEGRSDEAALGAIHGL